jgi:hypothetical protein
MTELEFYSDREVNRARVAAFVFAHEGEKKCRGRYEAGIGEEGKPFPAKQFKEASYDTACLEPRPQEPRWVDVITGRGKPGRPMTAEKAHGLILDYMRYDRFFSTQEPVEKTTKFAQGSVTSILYRLFRPKRLKHSDEDLVQDLLVKALVKLRDKDEGLSISFDRQSCKEDGVPCGTGDFCCFEKWITALKKHTLQEKKKEATEERIGLAELAISLKPDHRVTAKTPSPEQFSGDDIETFTLPTK